MYLPKIAKFYINKDNIKFHIEEIGKVDWDYKFDKNSINIKYKFFIEYLNWPLTTDGFNIDAIINFLKNKFYMIDFDITKDNICLHIHNDGWNFYYPEEYESRIQKSNFIGDIISINEYWIKTIIE